MLEGFGRFDLGINDADVRLALAALSSAIADPAAMMMTMKEKAAWSGNARILKDAIERSMLDSGKTLRPFPT
ncbi:MAG: hypothetical protein INR70_07340 [Parafilimonas terrae]|nr:hypothetical protein [Parafilimonas terrae]